MKNFSLLTWNIMGKRPLGSRILRQVITYLDIHHTDIVCLQENPHSDHLLAHANWYQRHSVVETKQVRGFMYNANTIFSRFPIEQSGEVSFSKRDNNKIGVLNIRDRHDCVWADIRIGKKLIRIYNCHLKLIATTARERLKAIGRVYAHAKDFSGSTIICGDMNTVMSQQGLVRTFVRWFNDIDESYTHGKLQIVDERYAFRDAAITHGFGHVFDLDRPTWALPYMGIELFHLKLDWFFVRKLTAFKHSLGPYISDHRPLHVECGVE